MKKVRTAALARGASKVLDMGASGKARRSAKTGRYVQVSNSAAMARDWAVTGRDLHEAVRPHRSITAR